MKYVAAVERFFPDQPGGSGRIAWELAKLFRERGHQVAMLCGSCPTDPPPGIENCDGVTVVRYRFPTLRSWDPRRLAVHIAVARAAAERYLGQEHWDVVHGHNLAPGLAAFSGLGAESRRLATIHSPAVLEQRINWENGGPAGRLKLIFGEGMLRRAESQVYRLATEISALSNYTVREIASMYGAELSERIVRIPWWQVPVDNSLSKAEARRRLGWPADTKIFFTLRRLVPRMGVDVLLEAVERITTNCDFSVYIAGDGPERPKLERMANSGPHSSRVHFVGRVTDEFAANAYRAADAFVLPTRSLECFGIIALEALARGTPVLASRVGAIPEMLDPILPNCLFPPGDSKRLSELMREINSGTLRLPADGALEGYVARMYSKEAVASAYVRWIEGVP